MQQQGIITPMTEVTKWCGPIVVTPKNEQTTFACVWTCQNLINMCMLCEHYQSPTPAEAVADITAEEAQYFTVIDVMKGYHQCLLAKESQELKTIITPFGRFNFL